MEKINIKIQELPQYGLDTAGINTFLHNRTLLKQEQKVILHRTEKSSEQKNRLKKTRKKSKIEEKMGMFPHKKIGHWSFTQNKLYYWFLEIHSIYFIQSQLRRSHKIFKGMSQFIGTREPEQCRSHHQKIILRQCRNKFYPSLTFQEITIDLIKNQFKLKVPLVTDETIEKYQQLIPLQNKIIIKAQAIDGTQINDNFSDQDNELHLENVKIQEDSYNVQNFEGPLLKFCHRIEDYNKLQ